MTKKFIVISIIIIVLCLAGVYFMLDKNLKDTECNNKSDLLTLLAFDDIQCNIQDIKINSYEVSEKNKNVSTQIILYLQIPKETFESSKMYNEFRTQDDYSIVFGNYGLSMKQFDIIGITYKELIVSKVFSTLNMPYSIFWGANCNENGDYDITVFTTVPQKIDVRIEKIMGV